MRGYLSVDVAYYHYWFNGGLVSMLLTSNVIDIYVTETRKIVPEDDYIDRKHVYDLLKKIEKKVEVECLFYTNMMFLSCCVLLELFYKDKIIGFDESFYFIDKVELSDDVFDVTINVIDSNIDINLCDEVVQFIKNRDLRPNEQYYQSYDTFDSLLRRIKIMNSFGDIEGKSILFLGDDELFCVLYAMCSKAARVTVLDIDSTLLKKIEEANIKFNLHIEVIEYDLLKGFPNNLYNQFDVFFASGLKDMGGLLVFIYSGLLSLNNKLESAGYFTFYEYNSINDKGKYTYELESKLLQDGVYFNHVSSCDQGMIPRNVIKRVVEKIMTGKFFSLYQENSGLVIDYLRTENVYSADPIFPLFAVKPIQVARIKRAYLDNKVEKKLHILRRFSDGHSFK